MIFTISPNRRNRTVSQMRYSLRTRRCVATARKLEPAIFSLALTCRVSAHALQPIRWAQMLRETVQEARPQKCTPKDIPQLEAVRKSLRE